MFSINFLSIFIFFGFDYFFVQNHEIHENHEKWSHNDHLLRFLPFVEAFSYHFPDPGFGVPCFRHIKTEPSPANTPKTGSRTCDFEQFPKGVPFGNCSKSHIFQVKTSPGPTNDIMSWIFVFFLKKINIFVKKLKIFCFFVFFFKN